MHECVENSSYSLFWKRFTVIVSYDMSLICSLIVSGLLSSSADSSDYSLSKEWKGYTFFDGWKFSTEDKTNGVVDYGDYRGLAYYNQETDSAIIKVDNIGSTTSTYTICRYLTF